MPASPRQLRLSLLPCAYGIVRFPPTAEIPPWAAAGPFFSVTRTADELSIVAEETVIPARVQVQTGWRAIKVHGPFPLSEIGVLASLAAPLAAAGISVFVLSTFETDYLLVAAANLRVAISALESAGHVFLPVTSA
ncbi:MAG TPA: ACT domain-containing protein [Candidatus Acidoferrum sp.]|nr:ACT domain-containing protein [Candidatus Acidoferrum sp.]